MDSNYRYNFVLSRVLGSRADPVRSQSFVAAAGRHKISLFRYEASVPYPPRLPGTSPNV